MNKKDRAFLIVFICLFVGYVIMEYTTPKRLSWVPTFYGKDKNPFGGFVLIERLPDLFGTVETSYETITQLDSLEHNLLVVAETMDLSGTDTLQLEQMLAEGYSVLLAAHQFNSPWLDTMGVTAESNFDFVDEGIFESGLQKVFFTGDTSQALYHSPLLPSHFVLGSQHGWTIHVVNEARQPLVISKALGSGRLILCSSPLMFTNFGLLYGENYSFAAKILELMPPSPVHVSYFYQLGRPEAQTPLRYMLSQSALKWGLNITLVLLLLLLVVSSRRKQQAIPIVLPPENTTLTYVKTLGNLYFQEGNHKELAEKMVRHFLHRIKEKYHLSFEPTERFYHLLSVRSEVPLEEIGLAMQRIAAVRHGTAIKGNELLALARQLNKIVSEQRDR